MTPEQALAEAKLLYETERPVGWRTFSMGGIKVANRVLWYESQIKRAYPYDYFDDAERQFYGDLKTVLEYVNAGLDPNLVGDMRQTFRSLCRLAPKVARRIHNEEDPIELNRRLEIFGLNRMQ